MWVWGRKLMTAMRTQKRKLPFGFALLRGALCLLFAGLGLAAPLLAQRPERPTLAIAGYTIDAELDPVTHHLAAKTVVTFTAPPTAELVSFGFHPALKVNSITDETGKVLTGERSADGTIRVTPPAPFVQGQPVHWTFDYAGTITGNEDGPIEGLKLAAIQEPITYLLYPARWFPMTGYLTNRFTAQMHIRVPQGMRVFASGSVGASKSITLANGKPGDQYDFNWAKPGFPGTVIAGRYVNPVSAGPGNVKVYLTVSHQTAARGVGSGTGRNPRLARRRQKRRPSAGQHHRAPVVGFRGQSPHPERRLDHERHGPLRRADVRGRRERQERDAHRPARRLRRCAGL
jgi:hypothetical protein